MKIQLYTSLFPLLVIFLTTGKIGTFRPQEEEGPVREVMVWMSNENGMKSHRILGLTIGKQGVLLAFTEARLDGSDEGPHDLVCKRSVDNGATWSTGITIEKSDGKFWEENGVPGKLEAWANPAALTDNRTGRIFIFYVLNEGEYLGHNMQRMTRVFYKSSDDEGLTWSNRVEITDVLNVNAKGMPHVDIDGKPIRNEDGFTCDYLGRAFHMSGPGHGIQLANGRLVLQFWHRKSIGQSQRDETTVPRAIGERLYSSSVISVTTTAKL